MFCGDEVSSIVADIGGEYCKFGAGGQDIPNHVFATAIGSTYSAMDTDSNINSNKKKYTVGDMGLRSLQHDMNITSPITNEYKNWDEIESLFQYGIEECMRVDPRNYPLLLGNSQFTTLKEKEKLFQLFFESFSLPAAYLAHTGTLSSIAAGRPTALVIDMGAAQTRIIPVVDGYTLNRAIICTNRGGNYLDGELYKEIYNTASVSHSSDIEQYTLYPWYVYRYKQYHKIDVTPSFFKFHQTQLIRDTKAYFCCVPTEPLTENNRIDQMKLPLTIPPYELPDGTLIPSSEQICFLPERVFFPSSAVTVTDTGGTGSGSGSAGSLSGSGTTTTTTTTTTSTSTTSTTRGKNRVEVSSQHSLPSYLVPMEVNTETESLSELVYAAVARSDVDVRRDLLSNILVVGGGGLIQGIPQRLAYELAEMLPGSMKVKINPMLPVERRFSPWIGGSVLSICGSFQQMWVSKEQYAEYGVNVLM